MERKLPKKVLVSEFNSVLDGFHFSNLRWLIRIRQFVLKIASAFRNASYGRVSKARTCWVKWWIVNRVLTIRCGSVCISAGFFQISQKKLTREGSIRMTNTEMVQNIGEPE